MPNNIFALRQPRRTFDPLKDAELKALFRGYFRFKAIDLPQPKKESGAYQHFSPVFATRVVGEFPYPPLAAANPRCCLIIQAVTAGWVWDDLHTLDTLADLLPTPRPVLQDWLTDLYAEGHLTAHATGGSQYWMPARITLYRYIEIMAWLVETFESIGSDHSAVLDRFGRERGWVDANEPVEPPRHYVAKEA